SAASSLVLPLVVNEIPRGDVTIVLQGEDILIRGGGGNPDRSDRGPHRASSGRDHARSWSCLAFLSFTLPRLPLRRGRDRPAPERAPRFSRGAGRRPATAPPAAGPEEAAGACRISQLRCVREHLQPRRTLLRLRGRGRSQHDRLPLPLGLHEHRRRQSGPRSEPRALGSGKHPCPPDAGDEFASTSAVGGAGFFGGIHFTRRFELDPWLIRTPLPSLTGAAETPTTLEVYVDGVLVRRERIQPGTFEIRNLPVATGSGRVHYVLRDSFGRETVHTSSYVVDGRLLQKGLSDFSYTLGFRRERLGTESFAYGEPTLLGYHRWGLSEGLTLG